MNLLGRIRFFPVKALEYYREYALISFLVNIAILVVSVYILYYTYIVFSEYAVHGFHDIEEIVSTLHYIVFVGPFFGSIFMRVMGLFALLYLKPVFTQLYKYKQVYRRIIIMLVAALIGSYMFSPVSRYMALVLLPIMVGSANKSSLYNGSLGYSAYIFLWSILFNNIVIGGLLDIAAGIGEYMLLKQFDRDTRTHLLGSLGKKLIVVRLLYPPLAFIIYYMIYKRIPRVVEKVNKRKRLLEKLPVPPPII